MEDRFQVNVELPATTLFRLKRVALQNRVRFRDLALVAFQHFLALPSRKRAAALVHKRKKTSGRKLRIA